MINNFQNKKISTEDIKIQKPKNLYHFPGEGKYKPMSIEAQSQEEAEAIYEKDKQEF